MAASEVRALQRAVRDRDSSIGALERRLAGARCAAGSADAALARERMRRRQAEQSAREFDEEVRCLFRLPPLHA
jgi:hypothetical protein